MPKKRLIKWNKQTMALAIAGGILAIEVVGYIVMMSLGVVVPDEYLSFLYTTLTVFAAMGGSQVINGKIARAGAE